MGESYQEKEIDLDTVLDLDSLRLTPEAQRLIEAAQQATREATPATVTLRARVRAEGERFICGPMPMRWWFAIPLPAKVAAGLWLWHLHGMLRTRRHLAGDRTAVHVNLSKLAADCGRSRLYLSRGLRWLERRGLVTVDRKAGQKLVVRIVTEAKPRA